MQWECDDGPVAMKREYYEPKENGKFKINLKLHAIAFGSLQSGWLAGY